MIRLTRLNEEEFVLNCRQIEYVEMIPETKIVMVNSKFHLVKEDADTVIDKIVHYYAQINSAMPKVVQNKAVKKKKEKRKRGRRIKLKE